MRVRNILVLAMATLLLAGCGAVNAGSAATVAGTEISESALAAAMNELTAEVSATELGASEAELTTTVLNRLVILEVVRNLGAEAEVNVSESEIAAERSRVTADFGSEAELIQAGFQQGIPPSLI
ncbi:MAG: SurA N-terminal domain-containing protein, partial [Candidatus Nanopelagicales bacterium]